MECPNCHQPAKEHEVFCANCGTKIQRQALQPATSAVPVPVAQQPTPVSENDGNMNGWIVAIAGVFTAIIALLLVVVIVVGVVLIPKWKNNDDHVTAQSQINSSAAVSGLSAKYSVGDILLFGSYEQDNDARTGQEPIEWIVLDAKDNQILVISRYVLDCQRYNSSRRAVTWETCTLRAWLNDDFYNTAFTQQEKDKIVTTHVQTGNNPYYGTAGGNATDDKLYLLSLQEAQQYMTNNLSLSQAVATPYAASKGIWESADNGGYCWWWFRTSGKTANRVAGMSPIIGIHDDGNYVNFNDDGVRPCMWITLQ